VFLGTTGSYGLFIDNAVLGGGEGVTTYEFDNWHAGSNPTPQGAFDAWVHGVAEGAVNQLADWLP